MESLDKIRRGGRRVIYAGVVAAIVFVAWILSHFMGGGAGLGVGGSLENANAPRSTPPVLSTQPTEAMVVVVTGDRYMVSGREMTLASIIAAAGNPQPGRTAVMIVSGPDARLGTQKDLQNALDAAGLSWGMQTEPAGQ
jgi:hypothetical protein